MLGIALGVTVLITVLSVMNGFDEAIHEHFFAMAQQVTVRTFTGTMPEWKKLVPQLKNYPGVSGVAPFVMGQGLLAANGQTSAVLAYGISPTLEKDVSVLADKMIAGNLNNLRADQFNVVVGQKLANNLGVAVGDKLSLIVPTATLTPVGVFPRARSFTVVGIFKVGNGFGYDSQIAFINMNDAQKLFILGDSASGIQLKLQNFYNAPNLSKQLSAVLSDKYIISDWTQDYGAFFQAVKLEKTMMFLMLILIIAVATFNLVSMLVMVVADKKADIAILRTLGATPRTILSIFMVQGIVVGLVGTLLGLIGGIALATHVTELVNCLEQLLHVRLLTSDVYYVDFLPSKLLWSDVWHVCLVALSLSLLATLYPAWRAARTQPAEALRYE